MTRQSPDRQTTCRYGIRSQPHPSAGIRNGTSAPPRWSARAFPGPVSREKCDRFGFILTLPPSERSRCYRVRGALATDTYRRPREGWYTLEQGATSPTTGICCVVHGVNARFVQMCGRTRTRRYQQVVYCSSSSSVVFGIPVTIATSLMMLFRVPTRIASWSGMVIEWSCCNESSWWYTAVTRIPPAAVSYRFTHPFTKVLVKRGQRQRAALSA